MLSSSSSSSSQALGQFLTRTFNGHEIKQRVEDGFVDATAMARVGGRKTKHYHENKATKKRIEAI